MSVLGHAVCVSVSPRLVLNLRSGALIHHKNKSYYSWDWLQDPGNPECRMNGDRKNGWMDQIIDMNKKNKHALHCRSVRIWTGGLDFESHRFRSFLLLK